jgi:uncharacterized membrane protein (DUF2068 family)
LVRHPALGRALVLLINVVIVGWLVRHALLKRSAGKKTLPAK